MSGALPDIAKLMDPLKRRIHMMLARGIVRLVNDATKLQQLQLSLLANETRESVERFQEYGFTSHPLAGAECLTVWIGGMRDNGVVLAVDDSRHRPTDLAPGEVAIYSNAGNRVTMKNDGSIEVVSPVKVRVIAPVLECTGDIIDQCETNDRTIAQMRGIYNGHTHGENDSGGTSDAPGQVM